MADTRKKRQQREERVYSARRRVEEHSSGFSFTSIDIPDGMEMLKIEEGTYLLDFIPYDASDCNPHADEGMPAFERTYWTHYGIGADEKSYCCVRKTYGEKCAVCDELGKMARSPSGDATFIKDKEAKERQLFQVRNAKQKDKGLLLMEASFHNFGKFLDQKIQADLNLAEEDQLGYECFFDPDKGFTVQVTFAKVTRGGYTFIQATNIEFRARKNPIPDDVLSKAVCLDELPKRVPYDELRAIFLQVDDEKEEKEEEAPARAPSRNGRARPRQEEEPEEPEPEPDEEPDNDADEVTADQKGIVAGSTVRHKKLGLCEVLNVSNDGLAIRLEDEAGRIHKAINPADCEMIVKKKEPPGKKPRRPEPEPEPEEEDPDNEPEKPEEEPEPPKKKPGRKPASRKDDDWED